MEAGEREVGKKLVLELNWMLCLLGEGTASNPGHEKNLSLRVSFLKTFGEGKCRKKMTSRRTGKDYDLHPVVPRRALLPL